MTVNSKEMGLGVQHGREEKAWQAEQGQGLRQEEWAEWGAVLYFHDGPLPSVLKNSGAARYSETELEMGFRRG